MKNKKQRIKAENNPALMFLSKETKQKAEQPKAEIKGIPTGYKLVRSEIKNKRVNLVLTQTNFDKLHRVVNKEKQSNPKASINELINKYIESIKE